MNPFIFLAAFITLASALTINTPASVVTCEPLKFTWDAADSKPPFFLALFPAGQPGAEALKQFPPQSGDSYVWDKVDLQPNTGFTAGLKDSDGNQAFSATATVRAGSNTDCDNANVVENKAASATSSSNPAMVEPGVATASPSGAPPASRPPAAATSPTASSPSAAPKTAAASLSGSNVPPSQSPSVKANSAARDTTSAVIGILSAVGVAGLLMV